MQSLERCTELLSHKLFFYRGGLAWRGRVSTVGKPATCILSRDGEQRLGNGLLKRFSRAGALSAQQGLHFGERLFNRGEIGRVSWQEQQAAASGFYGSSDTRALMNAQIIQNHDLPWLEAGSKQLLHVDLESSSISGPIQHKSFSHALHRQRSDQRQARAIVARNLADGSLSSGSIGIQGSHGDMAACLIHKHQIRSLQLLGLLAPSLTRYFILLACS